ncbi:head maturation protease [Pseudomonas phage Psa21]|uniref:Virion structural protein n=1 Tax=Pseudomonas phage Psa21 TaxID=2530023 RepID=A0A481W5I1_9CAUD|nr:head maturation protease [Pseudomonas phage Psa21]QBJ02765.1 virion structural protein [Pseudomonas phage Psa21]
MSAAQDYFGVQKQAGNQVRISGSLLTAGGKKGILTPDADGYYTLCVGAYGTHNSAGMFYDAASGVSMFAPDSPLMRRLLKNVLYMEFKHPEPFTDLLIDGRKFRKPMDDREYLQRIRKIDDDRVCAHIRALTIVDGKDEQGRPCKLVIAEVKPYGPYAKIFQDSITNPHINTYCSVRSITQDDVMRGIKYTREISTWDFVGEGGIYVAGKHNSPALENFESNEMTINPTTLWGMQDEAERRKRLGLESAATLDVTDLIRNLGWERRPAVRRPAYMR